MRRLLTGTASVGPTVLPGCRWSIALIVAPILVACQPVEMPQLQPGLPRTEEVARLAVEGMAMDYPRGGVVDTLPPTEDAALALRIRGPEITLDVGDGTWTGPSYDLELRQYVNPQALTAEGWVRERVFGVIPDLVQDTIHTRVSGRAAVRVATLAGDAHVITVYVPRDRQMVALRYFSIPPANHPAAPIMDAVHSMMVSTFRYIEQ